MRFSLPFLFDQTFKMPFDRTPSFLSVIKRAKTEYVVQVPLTVSGMILIGLSRIARVRMPIKIIF